MERRQGRKGCQVSRFKNMKFDVTCDSNGTNAWIPIEQAKSLLCDAMALESENERLRQANERLRKAFEELSKHPQP